MPFYENMNQVKVVFFQEQIYQTDFSQAFAPDFIHMNVLHFLKVLLKLTSFASLAFYICINDNRIYHSWGLASEKVC